ncbi:hypothetical protein PT974_05310 [Cladobotryum mycophilum]|uniref:Inosine/uridine-preferring nucleoside hydrolase domain-containing protein n=1 Tax=Cladobotryum mycophilum TaxID=491253 RepID=A0ABR0SJH4_9HYPO
MYWRKHLSLLSSLVFPAVLLAESTQDKHYVILDNDWETVGFVPFLTALDAGVEVLGLTTVTGDTWQRQCAMHAVATLELGNLSCIPVFQGPVMPLVNTPQRLQAWQGLHGHIPYQGAFAPQNKTAEDEGSDPSGGDDPNRIVKGAFFEGFPTGTPNETTNAAEFLVDMVNKYPGQISILAAGPLTNIALAVRLDSTFASKTKSLVIMGGYLDFGLRGAIGGERQTNLYDDINFRIDPEAAKIALNAGFPSLTIAGNVALQVIATPEFVKEVYDEVKNPYTELFFQHYMTGMPFWDETAALLMVEPSISINQTTLYVDVDTAFDSPFYGDLVVYHEEFAPKHAGKAVYVNEIDATELKKRIKHVLQYPKSCKDFTN